MRIFVISYGFAVGYFVGFILECCIKSGNWILMKDGNGLWKIETCVHNMRIWSLQEFKGKLNANFKLCSSLIVEKKSITLIAVLFSIFQIRRRHKPNQLNNTTSAILFMLQSPMNKFHIRFSACLTFQSNWIEKFCNCDLHVVIKYSDKCHEITSTSNQRLL